MSKNKKNNNTISRIKTNERTRSSSASRLNSTNIQSNFQSLNTAGNQPLTSSAHSTKSSSNNSSEVPESETIQSGQTKNNIKKVSHPLSHVWNYIERTNIDGVQKNKCTVDGCTASYSPSTSATILSRHLSNKHKIFETNKAAPESKVDPTDCEKKYLEYLLIMFIITSGNLSLVYFCNFIFLLFYTVL